MRKWLSKHSSSRVQRALFHGNFNRKIKRVSKCVFFQNQEIQPVTEWGKIRLALWSFHRFVRTHGHYKWFIFHFALLLPLSRPTKARNNTKPEGRKKGLRQNGTTVCPVEKYGCSPTSFPPVFPPSDAINVCFYFRTLRHIMGKARISPIQKIALLFLFSSASRFAR